MDAFIAEIWTARWQLAKGILAKLEISAAAIAIGSAIGLGVGVGLVFAPMTIACKLRPYSALGLRRAGPPHQRGVCPTLELSISFMRDRVRSARRRDWHFKKRTHRERVLCAFVASRSRWPPR
jgi:hypothetical protein